MAFLERALFVRLEEYTEGLQRRIGEEELQEDELYTLMMRTRSEGKDREAARMSVRMLGVATNSGLVAVRFAFLDDDLKPVLESEQNVSDGLVTGNGILMVDPSKRKFPVIEGYLKDYDDGIFGDILRESDELVLTGSNQGAMI